MAHVITSTSSATGLNSAPLSPSDINFEDLITVNSALMDQASGEEAVLDESGEMQSSNNVSDDLLYPNETTLKNSPVPPEPTIAPKSIDTPVRKNIVNLTKILPKQSSNVTSTKLPVTMKGSNSGQVVIIQGPTGPVPIRIAGSTTATTNRSPPSLNVISTGGTVKATVTSPKDTIASKGQPVTIKVMKMPDGSLVPVKNNKALNLRTISNISQLNVNSGTPVIVKSSNGSKTVIGPQSKLSSGSQVLKSLTLAEAQKAGFIKPKTIDTTSMNKIQKISSASTSTTVTSSGATTTTAKSIVTKEVTIKSETDGTTKQIVVPQHMLKLPSSSRGGSIQAIQIPGKQGLQYVRVLAPGSTGSGTKVLTTVKKEGSPNKTHVIGTQRVVMNSNVKPGLSLINSSKDPTSATAKGNMRVISTVPMLRKIQENTSSSKLLSSSVQQDKEVGNNVNNMKQLFQIKKVTNVNSRPTSNEPKILNTQIASGIVNNSFTIKSEPVVRKVEPQPLSFDEVTRIKQYSSMKSPPMQVNFHQSSDFMDDKMEIFLGKRSPTPETLRRKHCNCTKSQCLKLYCDCFANGEFCQDCNCKECFNNLEYEDERQKAIKICLERNPNAFKPKITKARDQSDLRLHNKGCNCKRSGCLKNYCECYEAKIACSSNCKCFGCRNVEDRSDRDFEENQGAVVQTERSRAVKRHHDELTERGASGSTSATARLQDGQPANKQPYNFITQDVVDATIQCMIAQADECKKNGMSSKITERMVIEELGRCLVEIIDFSIRNVDS